MSKKFGFNNEKLGVLYRLLNDTENGCSQYGEGLETIQDIGEVLLAYGPEAFNYTTEMAEGVYPSGRPYDVATSYAGSPTPTPEGKPFYSYWVVHTQMCNSDEHTEHIFEEIKEAAIAAYEEITQQS